MLLFQVKNKIVKNVMTNKWKKKHKHEEGLGSTVTDARAALLTRSAVWH